MKLCIDPGHGFNNRGNNKYDPGACAGGVAEADIALQWGLTLKWVCAQNGIDVWMTRDDDKDSDYVGTRDNRANAEGCTHFISLHCNAATAQASGAEVFYRDNADYIFGKKVLAAALSAMGSKDRGMKTESQSQHSRLAVMDFKGAACLLEIGFITNTAERTKMLDRDVRLAFAQKLVAGLK